MGRVYVAPSASSVNGIAVLNESPTTSGGTDVGGWLEWNEGGFTGNGWHFGAYNPLDEWWNQHYQDPQYVSGTYANSEDGFSNWVSAESPENLNAALGSWSDADKIYFIGMYQLANCLS